MCAANGTYFMKTAQEWHAVIDEHGKWFRQTPNFDESWLAVKNALQHRPTLS